MRVYTKGFTLAEILIVFGLAFLIGSFAMVMNMQMYRSSGFRSERDLVVSLLQRARSQAMQNACAGTCLDGRAHGLAIRPTDHHGDYVLFQGQTYESRDISADAVFPANTSLATTGFTEVSFAQLSATTTATGGATLRLTDSTGRNSVISIGNEGQISWTN